MKAQCKSARAAPSMDMPAFSLNIRAVTLRESIWSASDSASSGSAARPTEWSASANVRSAAKSAIRCRS